MRYHGIFLVSCILGSTLLSGHTQHATPETNEEHSPHVTIENQYGYLLLRSVRKSYDTVQLADILSNLDNLLRHGANPNVQDEYGKTALMYAANKGDHIVVGMLLRHGADATIQDHEGITALKTADTKGFAEISKLILNSINRQAERHKRELRRAKKAAQLEAEHAPTDITEQK